MLPDRSATRATFASVGTEDARRARDDADRLIGWLVALVGSLFVVGNLPMGLAQIHDYAGWWHLAVMVADMTLLLLAVVGVWLPLRVLRAVWTALAPAALLLNLVSMAARHPDAVTDVAGQWAWSLEPAVITLFGLRFGRWAGVLAGLASGASVLVSALVFGPEVPTSLAARTWLHLGNLTFVVMFVAIRDRVVQLRLAETEARRASQSWVEATVQANQRAHFTRLVHDDVLAVFNAAILFRGAAPELLREDARSALSVLRGKPSDLGSGVELTAQAAVRLIADRIGAGAPHCEIARHHEATPAPPAAVVLGIAQAAGEAARNSRRHAVGAPCRARIEVNGGGVRVLVCDDGPGFDVSQALQSRHGIRDSIVGRMADLGGRAQIRSGAAAGTEVELTWHR